MENGRGKRRVIVRGAGDIASGIIHRLFNEGYDVIALEQRNPVCVRRNVCFAEAVYEGEMTIEGVKGRIVGDMNELETILRERIVPVLVDPKATILDFHECDILIDGRMLKTGEDCSPAMADLVVGLGPGFVPGKNCHLAIETNRGPNLGAVLTDRSPGSDTGAPAEIEGFTTERVLRAPVDGIITNRFEIGDFVKQGDTVARIGEDPVICEISGVLRGICRNGIEVIGGQKIGDIDPRGKRELCFRISDKARAIGEGVLQGIRSYENARFSVEK